MLAVRAGRYPRQEVRIVEAFSFRAAARKVEAPLGGLIPQLSAELHTLFGGHAGEGVAGRELIVLFREVGCNFPVAVYHFFVGDTFVRRPLVVAVREFPVLFPAVTVYEVSQRAHSLPPFRLLTGMFPGSEDGNRAARSLDRTWLISLICV